MIRVKVCGMKHGGNMLEVADAGADYLGFIFYERSSRYVGQTPDLSVFECIPAHIARIGVFVNEDPHEVIKKTTQYHLQMVQLHGSESTGDCSLIRSSGVGIIKAFGIHDGFDFSVTEPFGTCCDFFLFDTHTANHGGTGKKFNWDKLNEYNGKLPFFLGGGIAPEDAGKVKKLLHKKLFAIDINSCFEIEPGMKDVSLVRKFIQEIRSGKGNV